MCGEQAGVEAGVEAHKNAEVADERIGFSELSEIHLCEGMYNKHACTGACSGHVGITVPPLVGGFQHSCSGVYTDSGG